MRDAMVTSKSGTFQKCINKEHQLHLSGTTVKAIIPIHWDLLVIDGVNCCLELQLHWVL